jgi:hypothetical protein
MILQIGFLKKLVEIYDKQKELDDLVKKFKDICNKYLINKKVFYDEPNIIKDICYVRNDDRCIDLENTADKIYKRKPLQPLHSVKLGNFMSSRFEYATCDIYTLPTETEYVLK